MSASPFDRFAPDAQTFFARVCELISADTLAAIAKCDYGMDFDENLAALRTIIHQRKPPSPLLWSPSEVLELTRWSAPLGEEREAAQLFACATLLYAACDPSNDGSLIVESFNESLGPLVGLIRRLGDDWVDSGSQFIACFGSAMSVVMPGDVHAAFAAMALLLLLSDDQSSHYAANDWRELVDFVTKEDARLRHASSSYHCFVKDEEFVLGLTSHDQHHWVWRSHIHDRFNHPPANAPAEVHDALRAIASRVKRPG